MLETRAENQPQQQRGWWRRRLRLRLRYHVKRATAAATPITTTSTNTSSTTTTTTTTPRSRTITPRSKSRHRRPPPGRRKRGRTRSAREYGVAAAAVGRQLVFCSKIPCPLRLSPNPFSIAFLLLVIFSSDVWPHYVACAPPPHLRHSNRVRTASPDGGHHHKPGHRDLPAAPQQYRHHQQQLHFQLQFQFQPQAQPSPHRPWWTHSLKRYGRSSYKTRHNTIVPLPSQPQPQPQPQQSPFAGKKKWAASEWRSSGDGGGGGAWGGGGGGDAPLAPCSHVGDETNEVGARAFAADTVFEGKVRSKSAAKDAVGKYGVTFVVQRVYKDQTNGQTALRPKTQVRLYFVEKGPAASAAKPTAHCVQRYNFTKRGGDLTRANVKRGRRYIVFVNRIGPHNYTILGEPVPHTRKNAKAVNEVLCRGCVRQIGVWGLKNETAFVGERLRLVCRVKGTPLPALQWFKDGSPIIVTSRLRIQYKKKRSLLVIPEVRNSDSGKYECRGLGVQSIGSVSSSSIVSIIAKLDNITALWPLAGKPCPLDAAYCLNGGTCTYYETIGEFTCQCADGFNGGRCENKDVVNSNSTYEPITCYDGVTPSYPCVTVHKPLDYSLR